MKMALTILIVALILAIVVYLLSVVDTFRWVSRDEKKQGKKFSKEYIPDILMWGWLMSLIRLIWMKPKIDEMRGLT